jgi:cell division protein FtsW
MKSVQDLLTSNRRRGPMDVVLAAAAIALLGFGVVMVYSASIIEATTVFRNPQYFLIRQSIYAGLGLAILLVASRIDVHKLKPFTYPILGLVTLLMVLSVVGFGKSGGGATRWLAVGPVHIQPSEMAKLALILWLAYSLEKKREKMKSFSIGMLPHFIMAGILMLLCMKQPDFGSAVVLLFLTFALLFVAGARLGYLLGAALVGLMFAAWAVRFTNYRWVRLVAWSNMSDHRQDLAYQPFQSVMSFGSGEVTGLGLGKGLQVLYLPESHTDFISAIIGEELGFLGILGLATVFLVIVARGVRTALAAEDEYQSYIAFGISVLFGAQTLVNLAVSMAMLPTKGLTLPFISYGGSSLLVSCAAMGILLSISRRTGERENAKIDAPTPPPPEVSAMLVTEAGFAPEPVSFRGMSPRGAQ